MKTACNAASSLAALTLGVLIFSLSGCGSVPEDNPIAPPADNPTDLEVYTTRQRTVVPDLAPWGVNTVFPYEVAQYAPNGYGTWQYDSGLDAGRRLDLLPADYDGASVTNAARLLTFFAMTDIHITDEESPAQAILMGYRGGSSSAYSPVMMYTTQVLDAAVETINALHQKHPFDFGISLGDTCNSTQYNETRWYIDVLDGGIISPDSGVKDDPIPGPSNDYQDEFRAVGLDKTIPWYQTLGNHDHFFTGFLPANDYIRRTLVGTEILNLGNPFVDPAGADSRGLYMGALDGRTPYGDVIGAGPVASFPNGAPTLPAADRNRRSLSKAEWMSEFLTTASNPVGHGFSQSNVDNDFACYSFEPRTDIPLKVIVLDDTQREDDLNNPETLGYGHGSLDQARYDWLVSELDRGQATGRLMIIAAHIPIGVEVFPSMMAWNPEAPISEAQLLAKLHTYSNLLLWIAGHRHNNQVTALPYNAADPSDHPELGFWEIETSSLRDFPQQFRTFEIVRNSDNTISIFATDIDPAIRDGSLAARSRAYAVAAQQLFQNPLPLLPTGSYNAELVKQLSPAMQAEIQDYGTAIPQ
jgi:metallophosphoesterase (TIGR03768 family)